MGICLRQLRREGKSSFLRPEFFLFFALEKVVQHCIAIFKRNRLHQRKAQLLPWIADPLTHVIHNEHEEQEHYRHASEQSLDTKGGEFGATIEDRAKVEEEIEAEEASSIELFYDLFFVANLTTVTSVHYMVDMESVTSYILFFVILWFTWLQTSLYDIRFSVDSFYERTIKAIHFFVMM